jgi:NADP-dependent 3-hydroxy acid dehydrogenase YdfG
VRVALLARTRDTLENLAREIGNGSLGIPCDVASRPSVETAIEKIRMEFGGPPDIIVNNAGLFTIKAIEETTAADFESMVTTNLTAPFAFVRAFLGEMKSRGSGHIITIGSVADRHIFAGNAAYSATKFGARAMHEVLRAETRGTGVRTTLVSPAAVDTDIWDPIQFLGTTDRADRSSMLDTSAVANAVTYAVAQPEEVNIDELRLSRS